MATPRVMMNGTTDPEADGQLVHKADCSSTGCDGDHGTGHVDVCTERYYEVTDLLAYTVIFWHIPD